MSDSGAYLDGIVQAKLSKNVRDLEEFLCRGNFIVEKGNQTANIIDRATCRIYSIPPTRIGEFFTSLEACRRENRSLHYLERQETAHCNKSGIMIDADCFQHSNEPTIGDSQFQKMSCEIARLLNEYIDFTPHAKDEEFKFHIFYIRKTQIVPAKDTVQKNYQQAVYRDGFHVLIPEICVLKVLKQQLLRDLAASLPLGRSFAAAGQIVGLDGMLDTMCASNPVYFLGNSKLGTPAYKLVAVHEMTITCDSPSIGYRTLTDVLERPLNLAYELSLSFILDRIGGSPTWLQKRHYDYRTIMETRLQTLAEKTKGNLLAQDELRAANESIDIMCLTDAQGKYLKSLLEILDISYATEYRKWYGVLAALANTSHRYKDLAWWFSHRKPESWSQNEFERVWKEVTAGYERTPLTKRSIIYWAKQSSPARFKELHDNECQQLVATYAFTYEGRVEHGMVANVLYSMLGEKFAADTADLGRSYQWFEFVLPGQAMRQGEVYKWRREYSPCNLHLFLNDCIPIVYTYALQRVRDKKANAAEPAEAKFWGRIEKTLRDYTAKLSNDMFQNGVIRQAVHRFRVRGFCDSLDKYENVLGVGNGVLVVGATPKLIKGFHEYRISKFTDVPYVPYDAANPEIRTLMTAFSDIFTAPDVLEFMLMYASLGLLMRESAGILVILHGYGRNGKTFFLKMVHAALSDQYCALLKPRLLTDPFERAESANSALVQMRDKTFGYFDEFNEGDSLNEARIKTIANPNKMTARDLHEKQANYANTCDTVASTNHYLRIDSRDHGTWRRMRYYECKTRFCNNPDPKNANEKQEDIRYIYEFPHSPQYQQAMFAILVNAQALLCRKYGGDIKKVPVPTMAAQTTAYRNRYDNINRFISQMVVVSPNADHIALSTLANKYGDWYASNVSNAVRRTDVTSLIGEFANSCLMNSVTTEGCVKYLEGHRVRLSVEEPLNEGERLVEAHATHQIDIHTDGVRRTMSDVVRDIDNALVDIPRDNLKPDPTAAVHYQATKEVSGAALEEWLAQVIGT